MSLSDIPFAHFLPPYNHYFPDCHDLSAADSIYHDPTFSSPVPVLSHGVSSHFSASVKNRSAKSAFTMNTLSTEEMERFQKLSNEFEPDVQVRSARRNLLSEHNQADILAGPARIDKTIDPGNCDGLCKC